MPCATHPVSASICLLFTFVFSSGSFSCAFELERAHLYLFCSFFSSFPPCLFLADNGQRQDRCNCIMTEEWTYDHVTYRGCARPLGWDEYMCVATRMRTFRMNIASSFLRRVFVQSFNSTQSFFYSCPVSNDCPTHHCFDDVHSTTVRLPTGYRASLALSLFLHSLIS